MQVVRRRHFVVAFGTTTKEAFTGSATVVKSEDLAKRQTSNVANALVGAVPGLQMRGASGQPGGTAGAMNIRGISSISSDYAGTEPLISTLMKKNPGITAIFTMSDAMAIGAIRKLRDMGMKVPEDISVIGFDGISLGEYMIPRLTTIRQMEDRLADEGLEILLDCIENKSSPSHRLIPFELVEGESVADITA